MKKILLLIKLKEEYFVVKLKENFIMLIEMYLVDNYDINIQLYIIVFIEA